MIGTIDGRQWPIGDSYFVLTDGAYGKDDLLAINLSSLEESCRTWQLWDALAKDAETPEELAEAWAESFPKVFFEVHIGARMRPNGWPVAGVGWPGVKWNTLPQKEDVAYAEFVEHHGWRTVEWFEAAEAISVGEVPDLSEDELDELAEIEVIFRSHAGAVKWRHGAPGRVAKGHFSTEAVDSEGERLGQVELFFNATPCNTYSPLVVVEEVDVTTEGE